MVVIRLDNKTWESLKQVVANYQLPKGMLAGQALKECMEWVKVQQAVEKAEQVPDEKPKE